VVSASFAGRSVPDGGTSAPLPAAVGVPSAGVGGVRDEPFCPTLGTAPVMARNAPVTMGMPRVSVRWPWTSRREGYWRRGADGESISGFSPVAGASASGAVTSATLEGHDVAVGQLPT